MKSAHSNGVSVLEGIRHFYSRLSVQTQSHFFSLHFGQNLRFAGSPALGEVRVSRVAHISARNEDRVLPRDVFIALPFTHKGITATAGAEDLPQLWKWPGTLVFKDRVRFLVPHRAQAAELCQSQGGRPGLLVPNNVSVDVSNATLNEPETILVQRHQKN